MYSYFKPIEILVFFASYLEGINIFGKLPWCKVSLNEIPVANSSETIQELLICFKGKIRKYMVEKPAHDLYANKIF